MALIGFLLFAASCTVAGGLLVGGRNVAANGHLFGYTFGGLTESGLFASGLVVGILFAIALSLFFSGLGRGGRRRALQRIEARRVVDERKELGRRVDTAGERADSLAKERDELTAELEWERATHKHRV